MTAEPMSHDLRAWAAIVLLAALTVLTRSAFLLLPERWQPRGLLADALGFVPVVALVAIAAPEGLRATLQGLAGWWDGAPGADAIGVVRQVIVDGRLPSALVVLVVGARRDAMRALAAGIAVFLLLRLLG